MNQTLVVRISLLMLLWAGLGTHASSVPVQTGNVAPKPTPQSTGVSYSVTSACIQSRQPLRLISAPATKSASGVDGEKPKIGDAKTANNETHSAERPEALIREPSELPIGTAPRDLEWSLKLGPPVDVFTVPQPDPVRYASAILGKDAPTTGGLWISGDLIKAMNLLRLIAGDQETDLLSLNSDGNVRLRLDLILATSGADRLDRPQAGPVFADYLVSHEGLRLLTELTLGKERYLLRIGNMAPTMGEEIRVSSTINLDGNFDSRINPRRPNGQKARRERPPEGFDSLVAMNPTTRWVSLQSRQVVPLESILFHELAEAHAKVALGLDYLPMDEYMGAHALAIERESRFTPQRPFSGAGVTAGWIRVFAEDQQ